jgi:hypothetical protein
MAIILVVKKLRKPWLAVLKVALVAGKRSLQNQVIPRVPYGKVLTHVLV